MTKIHAGIACNLDNQILAAAFPLLQSEQIEAIEWSFDTLFDIGPMPPWFDELLQLYSKSGRLVGHGVFFSLFNGRWTKEQSTWLKNLTELSKKYQFEHVTEHFGFMTGQNFHDGAPLNIPFTSSTLNIGIDRLARIQQACNCPVGLENLAFAYHLDEVKRHGEFLLKLIEPINGFIILDLHNLYCQLKNFDLAFEDLIDAYPVDRVREIHISGGSWVPSVVDRRRSVRRDTHDDRVPEEVFHLLEKTMPLCPNLEVVVMEQLGAGLHLPREQKAFRADFEKMKSLKDSFLYKESERSNVPKNDFLPINRKPLDAPLNDEELYQQQVDLSMILENAIDHETATELLKHSSLANSCWEVEKWTPYMLETAVNIAQKWKGSGS